MRTNTRSLLVVLITLLLGTSLAMAQQASLKVGDKAPDFKLMGSDGKEYTLAQFAGNIPCGVVLDTPRGERRVEAGLRFTHGPVGQAQPVQGERVL